ncbi:MAG: hypothetical protein IH971_07850 [Candidatus Marinimicrobia bacterium]|nr:hypothetical protein [Candidatus Neomarinimicrobiota bacterium]
MTSEIWIPIIAIIFGVGGTVGIIALLLILSYKKRQTQSREILAAIEKGMDIPLALSKARNYRTQGLVWTAVGIALTIAIGVSSQEWAGAVWGLLPLAVGVAFLLIARGQEKRGEEKPA